jgi:hypothetical protein
MKKAFQKIGMPRIIWTVIVYFTLNATSAFSQRMKTLFPETSKASFSLKEEDLSTFAFTLKTSSSCL